MWVAAARFPRFERRAFIALGGAIGVAGIVLMSVMLAGLETNILNHVLTAQSDIRLTPPEPAPPPLRAVGLGPEDAKPQEVDPGDRIAPEIVRPAAETARDSRPILRPNGVRHPRLDYASNDRPQQSGDAVPVAGDRRLPDIFSLGRGCFPFHKGRCAWSITTVRSPPRAHFVLLSFRSTSQFCRLQHRGSVGCFGHPARAAGHNLLDRLFGARPGGAHLFAFGRAAGARG